MGHLRQEPFVAGVHNDAHKKLINRGSGERPTGRSLVHGSSPTNVALRGRELEAASLPSHASPQGSGPSGYRAAWFIEREYRLRKCPDGSPPDQVPCRKASLGLALLGFGTR